jgi:ABC-type glycerol-3-phosphate transport system substrate-binding protein
VAQQRDISGRPHLLSRREVLRLAGLLVGSSIAGSVLAACAPRRAGQSLGPSSLAGSPAGADGSAAGFGTITMLGGSGDPLADPAVGPVYNGFRDLHPGTDWDIRPLAGGGPDWDRLARAVLASGDPVDLVLIDGQQVRGWVRDGLLADLSADPELRIVLDRVPDVFKVGGAGEAAVRAFPLAVTHGINTTGLYYNKALLDQVGAGAPKTIADLKALVQPLKALGAAPLVHCSGDVVFNQILVTWVLPMIVERDGVDPNEFAERTVKGEIGYDSPEWLEAFATIADLRASGVLLDGSGATDYGAMQQLLLQGKAAATFQGSWMLPQIRVGTATTPWELHVAPPPLVDGATIPRPIAAWGGFAIPTTTGVAVRNRAAVYAFLEYASRPEVDAAVVGAAQVYSPIARSNGAITDSLAREFLPLVETAISPLDWQWEPEIQAEIDRQVQALVKGETAALAAAKAVQAVAEKLRASGSSYYPAR